MNQPSAAAEALIAAAKRQAAANRYALLQRTAYTKLINRALTTRSTIK